MSTGDVAVFTPGRHGVAAGEVFKEWTMMESENTGSRLWI